MGKVRRSVLAIGICLIVAALFGVMMRIVQPHFDKDDILASRAVSNLPLDTALLDIAQNLDVYKHFFAGTEVLKVKVTDKEPLGNQMVTTLEIEKIYQSDQDLREGQKIRVIEDYLFSEYSNGQAVEYCNTLNFPMTAGSEYIVNLEPWKISNKFYAFRGKCFSCYRADAANVARTVNDNVQISEDEKSKLTTGIYFRLADLANQDFYVENYNLDPSRTVQDYNDMQDQIMEGFKRFAGDSLRY